MTTRGFLDGLGQDLRHALRVSAGNPGFACLVVLILALGIGASTAVFSVVNSAVLKRLPVQRPEELVWFRHPGFSYPIFQEIQARSDSFSGLFGWDMQRLHVDWGGAPEPTQALLVSGAFYETLGVRALAGRTLGPADDAAADPVAVISHACWRKRFGGDASVVGRTIRIERAPFRIVGIAPPGFFGVAPGLLPEVTLPLRVLPALRAEDADILRRPQSSWLHLMARLKPGVKLEQANAALQLAWPRVLEATTSPEMPPDRRARYLSRSVSLAPGSTGFSRVRNQFARPLSILLALVGLLLLVASATVANLLLGRSAARHREIAVRRALGASRGRIVRQLLTEGLALVAAGAVCGLLLAAWAGEALVGLLSTSRSPIGLDTAPDWRVLGFTLGVSLLSTVIFGLAPALRATRVDPGPALKQARVLGPERRRSRFGKSLVVSQVALSLLLLVGASLFVRSLGWLSSLDPGFERQNILIVFADAPSAGYGGERLAAYYGELLERLRSLPGVESASLSKYPPLSTDSGSWTQSVAIDGAPPQPGGSTTYFNAVSPGYFQTLRTPLLRGRDFGAQDGASGPRTVIVNETLARSDFPGQDPIGRRISIGRDSSRQDLEIVGVVKDAKYQRLQEPSRRIAYLPHLQLAELLKGTSLVAEVRTRLAPSAAREPVLREARVLDPSVPLQLESLAERIHDSLVSERTIAVVSAVLGLVALLLASAGLYGLMAYNVSRRTSEIGIRVALGARRQALLLMVLRESLGLAVLGVVLGLLAALPLGRFVESLLYGLSASDPPALAAACALMLAVAGVAGYLPARRASRLDPVEALRQE